MEQEEKKIKQILIADIGWIFAEKQIDNEKNLRRGTYRTEKNSIELFAVNGEMASVNWYRQGKREYNGKYVIVVEYF